MGDFKAICTDNWSFCDSNSSLPYSSDERRILFEEGWGPLRLRDTGLYSHFYDAYYNNARDFSNATPINPYDYNIRYDPYEPYNPYDPYNPYNP